MTSFFQRQLDVTPSYTLRALAHLLSYPGAELRAVVPELQQVLANEGAVSDQRLAGLNKLLGTIHAYPTFAEANRAVGGEWKRAHAPQRVLRWLERHHAWLRGGNAPRVSRAGSASGSTARGRPGTRGR